MMDEDGYPEQSDLDAIENWQFMNHNGCVALMTFVKSLWWPDGVYGWRQRGRFYRLSTGGWSGNESIIAALRDNKRFFWHLCWKQTRRGGGYMFEIPE
jgi:hypothetical protein